MDKQNKIKCLECQNDVSYENKLQMNDIVECNFCGAELEVVGFNPDGTPKISVVEEEK